MTTSAENNKRIAKNTLFLYFRQILIMAVSLYTVRVVLAALGEEDYGIYNVVGGFVAMFNVIAGALTAAISRFITFEMGRKDVTIERLQTIFSSSLLIQVVLGLLIGLLIAMIGVWFVEQKMVLPSGRIDATFYVLFFSSISFFVGLISVPYNALIIAHEQMKAFAYIGIVEVMLKLLVAYLLIVVACDKLVLYAVCMTLVALIVRSVYAIYCKRHFAECRFVWHLDKQLLARMFVFSGWAFLGNASNVIRDHGVNLLLNVFCGPVVNAARGITMQVTYAVNQLATNFLQAVNPQITKSYSAGQLSEMHRLIFKSTRFTFFLILILSLPLFKSTDYVLSLWLVSVPDHTAEFIRLMLVFYLIDSLSLPLITGLLAEGNIRLYEVVLSSLNAVNVIASYFALRLGYSPESVYVISIVTQTGITLSRAWLSGHSYALPLVAFFKEVYGKTGCVVVITGFFSYCLKLPMEHDFANFVIVSLLIFLVTVIVIYTLGIKQEERKLINAVIRKRIFRKS